MGQKIKKKHKRQNHRHHDRRDDGRRRDGCKFDILHHLSHDSDEEVEEDFISNLPDDILDKTLSLIPLDSAVQTAALSTRWRDFWSKTSVLNGSKEDIDCAVGDLVLHFDVEYPFKQPRKLHFSFGHGLVLIASLGLKAKLHLDFSKGKHEFPRDFGWHLVLNSFDLLHQSPQYASSVKNLDLTSVNYLTNDVISSLVSNFQSLESLTICKCEGLRSLRIDVVSKLLNLTILDCSRLKYLAIEAYELQSLRYRGPLCWFSLRGVVTLEDVKLECREGPGYAHIKYKDYDALLQAMRGVKILTLCGWIFKEILMPWLCNGHENFQFTALKELWWIDSSEKNTEALMSFLQFSPSLEKLFITIDPSSFYTKPSKTFSCWNKGSKHANLRHLKLVKLEGFADDLENIISLKQSLFDGFNVEPQIVIATNESHLRCLIKIPKQSGKGNPNNGASRKASYKFVEEIDDSLCSPHIHMCL